MQDHALNGHRPPAFEAHFRKECGMPDHAQFQWDAPYMVAALDGWIAHAAQSQAIPSMNVPDVTWPKEPGWYWAYGRIAGMRQPSLMSARALLEGDQLIVYVGEAMTHRLSFPDPELPLQFKPAMLPEF